MLAAPAISDAQLGRFKGIAQSLRIDDIGVTPGPAPTTHGFNDGRALVISKTFELRDGNRAPTSGQMTLTLLKDDQRVQSKGWLIWDIDFKAAEQVDKEMKSFLKINKDRVREKASDSSIRRGKGTADIVTEKAVARERIGSVLGKDVYRDQLKGAPPLYRDVVRLFMEPVLEEYHVKHSAKYEMTDDEIRQAVEWQAADLRKRGGEPWKRRQKGDERGEEFHVKIAEIETQLMDPKISSTDARQMRTSLRLAKLEEDIPHAAEMWFMMNGRKFGIF